MFGWLRGKRREAEWDPWADGFAGKGRLDSLPHGERRAPASETHRLNSGHWAGASGESINTYIEACLPTLRNRTRHEYRANETMEGIVETHVTDVVGEGGPALNVDAGEDKGFAQEAESYWGTWWERPELTWQMDGCGMLEGIVRALWLTGDALAQEVTDGGSYAINLIESERLDTPFGKDRLESILGISRDPNGRPLKYWVRKDDRSRAWSTQWDYTEVPAGDMIHLFRVLEFGQIRGLPLLASALETAGKIRDYEREVMEAARQAANFGVGLEWKPVVGGGGRPLRELNTITDLEPGTIRTYPAGYTPSMIKPEQPSTQYPDFIREQNRRLGRPVGMPVMMVNLDSSDHSWSSARFDSSLYWRQVLRFRALLERVLRRMARAMVTEYALRNRGGRVKWKVDFIWAPIPYVDPAKEAQAWETKIGGLQATLHEGLQANGTDWEDFKKTVEEELEWLRSVGLDWPSTKTAKNAENRETDGEMGGIGKDGKGGNGKGRGDLKREFRRGMAGEILR